MDCELIEVTRSPHEHGIGVGRIDEDRVFGIEERDVEGDAFPPRSPKVLVALWRGKKRANVWQECTVDGPTRVRPGRRR